MGKLTRWHQSSSLNPCSQAPLTPCSVSNDSARLCMAEITYRTACVSWGTSLVTGYFLRYTCKNFTLEALAAAASVYTGVTSWLRHMSLCYGYLWLCYGCCYRCCIGQREAVLWLPCQPGENIHVCTSYGSSISFQPLTSSLAYPGFSKQCGQCEQQNIWCNKYDQQYTLLYATNKICIKVTVTTVSKANPAIYVMR